MSHQGAGRRSVMRSVAFLTTGVLAVPALAACGSDEKADPPAARQDLGSADRGRIADGASVRWAVDSLPRTFNAYQSDADEATARVAGAVLPSMFRLDSRGRPERDGDFLESAKVVEEKPQVVLYRLNQQAVWSDGREIGAADFVAQWRALSGRDSSYWTARNAGYQRIAKIERGDNDLEVRVTFKEPYADWRSLFSPLYPKQVMGSPEAFNEKSRTALRITAGPFAPQRGTSPAKGDGDEKGDRKRDRDGEEKHAGSRFPELTLVRNTRWWGERAKLDRLILSEVPAGQRLAALREGRIDIAALDPEDARRLDERRGAQAAGGAPAAGPGMLSPAGALRSWAVAHGSDKAAAKKEQLARDKAERARAAFAEEQAGLGRYELRKSLEPAFTQLALNGESGPLADDRVRRAVARAIDRAYLARSVLGPFGLPAEPVGSHLALAGQHGYADGSGALGSPDTAEAQALLADAGWVPGGPVRESDGDQETDARSDTRTEQGDQGGGDAVRKSERNGGEAGAEDDGKSATGAGAGPAGDGAGPAGDGKSVDGDGSSAHGSRAGGDSGQDAEADADAGPLRAAPHAGRPAGRPDQDSARSGPGGAPGAYAPKGTAAPGGPKAGLLAKDGKALTLRFVLPSGPGSKSLREVGDRISRMLGRIGIRTRTVKVSDDDYFKDHIAAGEYDLALYSWPATAFPATDARPIYAKPVPGADGSLNVEQNYTRVGTDYIDQLFDKAGGELDSADMASLMRKADARIWAAAGSIPLYQGPQLVAVRKNLANVGAFGFEAPRYEDIGFLKSAARSGPGAHRSAGAERNGGDAGREEKDRGAGENSATDEKSTTDEKNAQDEKARGEYPLGRREVDGPEPAEKDR